MCPNFLKSSAWAPRDPVETPSFLLPEPLHLLLCRRTGEKYPSTGASNGSDVAVSVPTEDSSDAAVKDPVKASDASELDRTEDPVEGLKGTEAVEEMEEVADKEEEEDV
ncbi:predicted protein [Arabidopsis lyrata subsp. lyrata]|uniref:Predicted protein n=1 Tax=Arabidopsis lyrata subsp. lyrata TaxID=81972 RepID=D7L109_ARALL|nr:predicted protein [Arabidopsis lyrata subsp. lyrata]